MSPTNRPKMSNKTTSVLTGYQILSEHSLWYTGRDSVHYGAGGVQPPPGRCPPDTCISMFESLPEYQKTRYPDGYLVFWYTGRDSNPQPSEPESDALSIEPPVHLSLIIIAGFSGFVKGKVEKVFLGNSCFSIDCVI